MSVLSSRIFWIWALTLLAVSPLNAQDTAPRRPAEAASEEEEVPPLSVRTLFHPKDRFDYFGPPPVSTEWLDDSRLAIRDGDQWRIMDPETGETSAWDWPKEIEEELRKLTGFSDAAITAAARSAVSAAEDLSEPIMVHIGDAIAIIGGGNEPQLVTRDARAWQTPELAPDGSAIAFVLENDLYVIKIATGEVLRLTQDGSPEHLNGRLDWTYQEEIYGRGNFKGFWWSPDSRQIAFLSIDISDVLPFTLTRSDTPRGGVLEARYPKAGDPIPKASLSVVDTISLQITPVHRPIAEESESLVVRVTWRPEGRRLSYQVQNRIQTWLELRESEITAGGYRVLIREEGPAWIEILNEPHWLPGGDFLWLSDLPAGRRHVWLVAEDGTRRIPITSGPWDVREIVRVLPEAKVALVTGDQRRGTRGQQLYRVQWGRGADESTQAMALTEAPGWHSPEVSPDANWFTDSYSTLTREPTKRLVRITGEIHRELGPEATEASPWKSLDLPEPRWLDITTDDGAPLPAYIIPPHGVDTEDPDRRHPVLIYTYGGPMAPAAVDRWSGRNYLYHQLMAAEGIGVLVIDNRSSGGRGMADTWSVHRRLGVQELADLLEGVQYLADLPWVDAQRLGMRGWSFGGYYTAYAMTHSRAFAAGIAGGSVTDWRNYDAFYTERYMDTPQNNPAGYRESSVVEKAHDLSGRLLLVHGEIDDNVHPGNTLQLVAALQDAGKQFDMMIYPNAAHAVSDAEQSFHLHAMMLEFLKRELRPTAATADPSSSDRRTVTVEQ